MHQSAADPIPSSCAAGPASGRASHWNWFCRAIVLLAALLIGIFAGQLGMRFRHWMWDTTVPIRFISDIDRGYGWGRMAAAEGYLNQYEKMQPQQSADDNWLDYAPLRLGVMALWGKWSLTHYPRANAWHQDRSFGLTAPVLGFNLFMEAIGIVSAFFLTRLWVIRSGPVHDDPASVGYFFRGCLPGFVAALLLWFNPAIVLSGYGWPTWDLWIIPLFLLAALLASLDWWFTSGVILGIGAMFKGQQLLAVPVLVAWSLLSRRPLNSLKLISGVTIAIALITLPWLLSFIPAEQLAHARDIQSEFGQPYQVPLNTFRLTRSIDAPAVVWVLGVLLCATGLPWVGWLRLKNPAIKPYWERLIASCWTWRMFAASAAFAWVIWPWLLRRNYANWEAGLIAAASLAAAVLLIRPRGIATLAAAATGIALLSCMSVFHGSSAWYDCGLHFGTVHWPKMVMGQTDNLPGIMVGDFGWPLEDLTVTAFTLPPHFLLAYPAVATDISIRTLLLSLFWITFIPCCLGVAAHARRHDSRGLIALTAPWLMFFCFCPQIHERYLLFAAGISCICAGVSVGMTLLGIFLSSVTFIMTLDVMLDNVSEVARVQLGQNLARTFPKLCNESTGEKLRSIANGTHPDLGYAVVLCGLIFLYFSIAPCMRPRDRR